MTDDELLDALAAAEDMLGDPPQPGDSLDEIQTRLATAQWWLLKSQIRGQRAAVSLLGRVEELTEPPQLNRVDGCDCQVQRRPDGWVVVSTSGCPVHTQAETIRRRRRWWSR